MRNPLTRHLQLMALNLESRSLLENFTLSAALAVIVIRVLLFVTGYPQIGGGSLHIAHMLWGGLLLTLALFMSLLFLNKQIRNLAALVGGFGFGTFIDELGKFITSDNDYFFQPTFALIYVVFAVLYVASRILISRMHISASEYAVNALELMKELYLNDLDAPEKERVIKYLERARKEGLTVSPLLKLTERSKTVSLIEDKPFLSEVRAYFHRLYRTALKTGWFSVWMMRLFLLFSIVTTVLAVTQIRMIDSFWNSGLVGSTVGSGLLVLYGALAHRRGDREAAYRWYRLSILVSLLLTQFFLFYFQPVVALAYFLLNGVIYGVLGYLISEEKVVSAAV